MFALSNEIWWTFFLAQASHVSLLYFNACELWSITSMMLLGVEQRACLSYVHMYLKLKLHCKYWKCCSWGLAMICLLICSCCCQLPHACHSMWIHNVLWKLVNKVFVFVIQDLLYEKGVAGRPRTRCSWLLSDDGIFW